MVEVGMNKVGMNEVRVDEVGGEKGRLQEDLGNND